MNAPRTAITRVILATAVVFGLGLAATASAQLRIHRNFRNAQTGHTDHLGQHKQRNLRNRQRPTRWKRTHKEPSLGTCFTMIIRRKVQIHFGSDTGNHTLVPTIVHPKYTTNRFYRVVDKGRILRRTEPKVTVTTLTNGAVVSDELTVSLLASTDQSFLVGTKLYVDGQEMRAAESTTNYVSGSTNYELDTYAINTCEWRNGTHILFGTVECQSANAVTINPGASGHRSWCVPVCYGKFQ